MFKKLKTSTNLLGTTLIFLNSPAPPNPLWVPFYDPGAAPPATQIIVVHGGVGRVTHVLGPGPTPNTIIPYPVVSPGSWSWGEDFFPEDWIYIQGE